MAHKSQVLIDTCDDLIHLKSSALRNAAKISNLVTTVTIGPKAVHGTNELSFSDEEYAKKIDSNGNELEIINSTNQESSFEGENLNGSGNSYISVEMLRYHEKLLQKDQVRRDLFALRSRFSDSDKILKDKMTMEKAVAKQKQRERSILHQNEILQDLEVQQQQIKLWEQHKNNSYLEAQEKINNFLKIRKQKEELKIKTLQEIDFICLNYKSFCNCYKSAVETLNGFENTALVQSIFSEHSRCFQELSDSFGIIIKRLRKDLHPSEQDIKLSEELKSKMEQFSNGMITSYKSKISCIRKDVCKKVDDNYNDHEMSYASCPSPPVAFAPSKKEANDTLEMEMEVVEIVLPEGTGKRNPQIYHLQDTSSQMQCTDISTIAKPLHINEQEHAIPKNINFSVQERIERNRNAMVKEKIQQCSLIGNLLIEDITDKDFGNCATSIQNWKIYANHQTFIEQQNKEIEMFKTNDLLKEYRFQLQKAVNINVNTIATKNIRIVKEKLQKLDDLLSGRRVTVVDKSIVATTHPLGIAYCTNLLAKKIVKQGQVVAINPELASPIASLAISLWEKFPIFGKLLLGYFYLECPYLIPVHPSSELGTTDLEYYRLLGYEINVDGIVESGDNYIKRISGVGRLYFTMMTIASKKGVLPFGIRNAWKWLTSVMNSAPTPDISATLILECLEATGSAQHMAYKHYFERILIALIRDYMPILNRIDDGGPNVRLQQLLTKILETGKINETCSSTICLAPRQVRKLFST